MTIKDVIIDTNNRFNVLLMDLYDTEVESHTFPDGVDDPLKAGDPFSFDETERQYMAVAASNGTRLKLGYPPKKVRAFPKAPVPGDEEHTRLLPKWQRFEHRGKLLDILNRLKRWRSDFSREIQTGEGNLSALPLTLLEPLERWNDKLIELGGEPRYLGGSAIPPDIWEGLTGVRQ